MLKGIDRRYPTRDGIAIPLEEIDLPETKLSNRKDNLNNHHHEWVKKHMAEFALTQTLRDLTRHQTMLFKDQHDWVHRTFQPPVFPTPRQALDEVMEAYELNETLNLYVIDQKSYVQVGIPDSLIDTLKQEYEHYK